MSLDLRLGQRQEQRLALLPQMLQSIEVLQLATADLLALVDRELQQNETLEVAPAAEPVPDAVPERVSEREDSGWDEWRRASSDGGDDKKLGFLANVAAREDSLRDAVREQLAFREVPPLIGEVVMLLVDRLDARGLLPATDEELAVELDLDAALVGEARVALQQLEPRGLGAKDSIEAMLLQAAHDPDLAMIEALLRVHLEALGRNKLPDVARALSLSLDELHALLERVRTLDPRPAARFAHDDDLAVRPDAFAWLQDGSVQVALDDEALPDVQVNQEYAALAGDRRTEREVRDYLRPKLRSARDLIEAIQQRKATLSRVVKAVMREQRAFLERGPAAIRPLRMSEIAEQLELHTSTVSRTIAGKFVQTDRGVFALRDFFDGGRIDAAPIEGQGRMAVGQHLRELVDGEDKSAPLSDDDLVQKLGERGVQVARRTVAKYRRELDIPSSYLRRKYTELP
ncbi:MAG: RNA polymerase factor sigma-54 [Planctomycetes bacterium]|nr:RNA polymerase factor sigma-54 [Planctomycetota bacterium]